MANPDRLPADCPTAFYTFDVRVLSRRVAYLRSRLPENCSLCYAVKANPFIAGEIADRVDAFEICSPGEAAVCRALGIKSEKTVISGVYKTPSFIEGLIADADFRGVLTVESTTQYRLFCDLAEKYGRQIRVLLRLTNDSQFGINEDEIDEIVSSSEKTPLVRRDPVLFGNAEILGQKDRSRDRRARRFSCPAGRGVRLCAGGPRIRPRLSGLVFRGRRL